MTSHAIIKLITIEVPIDRVWAFVSSAAGLQQWWQAETLEIEMQPGGAYREERTFGGAVCRCSGTVLVVQPPNKLAFTLRLEQWPPDVVTRLSITLHPRAGHTNHATCTLVTLEHSGFDALPTDLRGVIQSFEPEWAAVMARLAAMFSV